MMLHYSPPLPAFPQRPLRNSMAFVLQHLRVRCSGGMQFHTRSSTMVRGRMGHRFMFIDGDKAVSGSYRSVKVFVFHCRKEEKSYMMQKTTTF